MACDCALNRLAAVKKKTTHTVKPLGGAAPPAAQALGALE